MTAILVLLAGSAAAAEKIDFTVHSGYFVSNKAKLEGAEHHLVILDRK
jgi:hypothetical protein